jgi:hypothetical protein
MVALIGTDAWLLGVVATVITEDETDTIGAAEPVPPLSFVAAVPEQQAIEAYGEIIAHPIFFRTRTPWVAPPPAPPAPPPPPPPALPPPILAPLPVPPTVITDPGLTLGGVVIDQQMRKAYLLSRSDPRGTWISEGETVAGWKLEAVTSMGVTLRQRDQTIELQLYPDR